MPLSQEDNRLEDILEIRKNFVDEKDSNGEKESLSEESQFPENIMDILRKFNLKNYEIMKKVVELMEDHKKKELQEIRVRLVN